MIKVLFLIHDLGQGGAEKVLVNLVNNMDKSKFDITVMTLFGGGVNEPFLSKDVRYISCFKKVYPGNSKIMKLFSPKTLHKFFVKEQYDIEVSYLEGPSARVISGCTNPKIRLLCWIHSTITNAEQLSYSFKNQREAIDCYKHFDKIVAVSEDIKNAFATVVERKDISILYNTIESDKILTLSKESCDEIDEGEEIKLIATGSLKPVKAFDRLLRIAKRLRDEGYKFKLYILGKGPLKEEFETYIKKNGLENCVRLLGYQTNPYKYVAKSELFVCSSHSEGFSTAVTEALILGIPVISTRVSGMEELLGENEYGMITDNAESALLDGIKRLLEHPDKIQYYKDQAIKRGKMFNCQSTVDKVEEFFFQLKEDKKC